MHLCYSVKKIKLLSSYQCFYFLHSCTKNVLKVMRGPKIQHITSLFHSKKRHSTSCLGTRKVHLLIFFGTIVKCHYLALIWVQLLLCILLLMCWAMVGSLLTFHFVVFIYFSLKDAIIFQVFLLLYYTRDHSRKLYLMIIDSNWFSMCQACSLFDVSIGFDVNH
jgi:hypothetical protein